MNIINREMLWRQIGAAIDMFSGAVRDCPDELWEENLWPALPEHSMPAGSGSFWYVTYHALFWLDLYLYGAEEGFTPPEPFDLVEMDDEGMLPPRVYTREELLDYLAYCRQKARETILSLTNEEASRICRFPWGELTFAELQLYNLRHVVEHGAQLRMFLGQQAARPARWIARAGSD